MVKTNWKRKKREFNNFDKNLLQEWDRCKMDCLLCGRKDVFDTGGEKEKKLIAC